MLNLQLFYKILVRDLTNTLIDPIIGTYCQKLFFIEILAKTGYLWKYPYVIIMWMTKTPILQRKTFGNV